MTRTSSCFLLRSSRSKNSCTPSFSSITYPAGNGLGPTSSLSSSPWEKSSSHSHALAMPVNRDEPIIGQTAPEKVPLTLRTSLSFGSSSSQSLTNMFSMTSSSNNATISLHERSRPGSPTALSEPSTPGSAHPSLSSSGHGHGHGHGQEQELRKTGLYDFHVENGAKMVPFAGYAMPLSYGSVGAGEQTR